MKESRWLFGNNMQRYHYSIASRDGLTFVEILVSVLVLGILALAGGVLVSRGQIDTGIQKYKRAAIEAANQRMEVVIKDPAWGYSRLLTMVGTPQGTNISLNNMSGFGMTTTVVNAGSGADNCLKVTVNVEYRKSGDTVALESYCSK